MPLRACPGLLEWLAVALLAACPVRSGQLSVVQQPGGAMSVKVAVFDEGTDIC